MSSAAFSTHRPGDGPEHALAPSGPAPLERLRRHHDPTGTMLTVYVTVPPDRSALRELSARLDAILDAATLVPPGAEAGRRARAARRRVHEAARSNARAWFGHSMALVATADHGLVEEIRLPGWAPDRAVFNRRPFVRPLLRAFQRGRPYIVVVVDRHQARLFEVDATRVRPAGTVDSAAVRDPSHAGWYGLEEYRTRHHAAELAHRHYAAIAAALEQLSRYRRRPIVVGGHREGVTEFLASATRDLRSRVAGSFVVDVHMLSPDDVRAHGDVAMATWEGERQRRRAADIGDWEASGVGVTGVASVAEAVAKHQVDLLVVSGDDMVPGTVCDDCAAIAPHHTGCPYCGRPAHPVADVIDEMVDRVLGCGGRVEIIDDRYLRAPVAARLRLP